MILIVSLQLRDNGNTDNRGFLQLVSSSVGMKYVTSSLLPFYNDDMWSVMLSRKSSSGADLTVMVIHKKYNMI